jgi:glycosyl transferase, family 25
VHAYVINLARSPDRRARTVAELEKCAIDYEFVEAIDGDELDLSDPQVTEDIALPFLRANFRRPRVVACALSHLSVHRKIIADGLECALVLEDDVIAPSDLASLADDIGEQLVGAEIALLNFDSQQPCKFSRRGSVDLLGSRQLVRPVDVGQLVSAAAYVITREACERMTKGVAPKSNSDDWSYYLNDGSLDRLRCVVPLAVAKNPNFASTIHLDSDSRLKSWLLAMASRHNFRVVNRLLAYRRRTIWHKYTRTEFVD